MLKMVSEQLMEKLKKVGSLDIFFPEGCFEKNERYYFDIATDGQSISYITKERLDRFNGDFWNYELRKKFAMKGKPSRVLQQISGREISTSEAIKIKRLFQDLDNYSVEVVSGTDIGKYYNMDMYEAQTGMLGSSCMRAVPSSFFMVYKDICEMAIVKNKHTGLITARALLYHDVHSYSGEEHINCMGRIYATDDMFKDMMMEWCFENEYHLFESGYDSTKLLKSDDARDFIRIENYRPYIPVNENLGDTYHCLPYMDNFGYCIENEDGDWMIMPTDRYIYDACSSYCYHNTDGYRDYDYCSDCSMVCTECYKHNNGYGDCDDCGYDYGDDECEGCRHY